MQNSHNNVQKMESDDDPFPFNEDSGHETSGDDDADYNVEMETDSNQESQCIDDDFQYEILSPSDVSQAMLNLVSEANTVLQIPISTTKTLLAVFKWDKEKLLDRFFDIDQDKIFADSNVVHPLRLRYKVKHPQTSGALEKCEICYDDVNPKHMFEVDCGHRFCYNCWNEYLTTQIVESGLAEAISCAAHNCSILLDDETVLKLVKDSKVKTKYQQIVINNFVLCNKQMRWCPSPDCNSVIRASYMDPRPVLCSCGHTFCFGCGENWHDPVKCSLIKKWIKKCDDDSETSNWISVNTKECPKCFATIEKDGGCNHMICKNQSCKADFCWVCLGAWEPHGSSWYTCNKYDEEEAQKARNAQELSRAALQRYLFYCNRYMNHMQSLKFENKLYSSVKVKMDEMQHHNMSWIEVQFLKNAVDILCKCRQTLMNTYVFAYYLKKNNQSVIFEENQKDLERATECLSEYLERDITQENLINIKQKVLDKCKYCDVRRKVLLDHVHEGYEKEWWTYTD